MIFFLISMSIIGMSLQTLPTVLATRSAQVYQVHHVPIQMETAVLLTE